MKRRLIVGLAIVGLIAVAWASSVGDDATERLRSSAQVLKQIASAPDKGIPEEVVKNAKCIVVFPDLIKAGLIVGGKYGHGVAVCRTASKRADGWSAPAFITISGGTFGPQIGAEGVDLVMIVMNDKGLQELLSNKVRMSLEGSAAAGSVGRHATVGTDWKMDTEALSYSRTKGLFVGVALDGAKIQQDNDSTLAFYGKNISFRATLSGNVHAPARSDPFLAAVRAAEKQTSQHETAENK